MTRTWKKWMLKKMRKEKRASEASRCRWMLSSNYALRRYIEVLLCARSRHTTRNVRVLVPNNNHPAYVDTLRDSPNPFGPSARCPSVKEYQFYPHLAVKKSIYRIAFNTQYYAFEVALAYPPSKNLPLIFKDFRARRHHRSNRGWSQHLSYLACVALPDNVHHYAHPFTWALEWLLRHRPCPGRATCLAGPEPPLFSSHISFWRRNSHTSLQVYFYCLQHLRNRRSLSVLCIIAYIRVFHMLKRCCKETKS